MKYINAHHYDRQQNRHYVRRHALGWKPDLPGIHDCLYAEIMAGEFSKFKNWLEISVSLPQFVDLRPLMPPIYDQLQIGACTANAWAGLFQYLAIKETIAAHGNVIGAQMPSRRFIYHKEMMDEGDCNGDNGAQVRTGGRVLSTVGVCAESDYPYSDNIQDFIAPISNALFAKAWWNKGLQPYAIDQTFQQMQVCLAAGFPFPFGFSVYQSFENVGADGIVPMPKPSEQPLGGHCVLAVGYDESKKWIIVRNSWNTTWGDAGYCYMPISYLTNPNLASSFWTLRSVE